MVDGVKATKYEFLLLLGFTLKLIRFQSCEESKYIEHPSGSQVVQTAWACIALLEGHYPDRKPIERGLRLIMSRQQANGEWPQEAIEGVFNKSCMISYPNYKFIFPMKALGLFAKRFGDGPLHE